MPQQRACAMTGMCSALVCITQLAAAFTRSLLLFMTGYRYVLFAGGPPHVLFIAVPAILSHNLHWAYIAFNVQQCHLHRTTPLPLFLLMGNLN
jgi:hypothetical protein